VAANPQFDSTLAAQLFVILRNAALSIRWPIYIDDQNSSDDFKMFFRGILPLAE